MKNKGFTLIELVGIIVVLAAIFLVSFPNLLNMSKKDEEKKYNEMVEDLCLAGKSYIYSNMGEFPELSITDSEITIPISDLMEYGNVNSNRKNVNTNRTLQDDNLIYTVLNDKSLDCRYVEGS